MTERKQGNTKEYSPREIYDVVERSRIKEFAIDNRARTIVVENRLDLYNLLASFELATFKKNGNEHVVTDPDGVPILDKVDDRVKFRNSFEKNSPAYLYPVTAVIGAADVWTIMGDVSKAIPSQKT